MVRILIADDHVLIREGLKKILKTAPEMVVVAEAGDAREVIQAIKSNELDVVVLDISLPGKSGLELLKDIKLDHPKLPILILSMHPEDRFAVRALKAGAAGYVTKESAAEELIKAIRKVIQGRKLVDELVLDCVPDEFSIRFHVHFLKDSCPVCIDRAHAEIELF